MGFGAIFEPLFSEKCEKLPLPAQAGSIQNSLKPSKTLFLDLFQRVKNIAGHIRPTQPPFERA